MLEQCRDLSLRKLKYLARQALLMRALIEDAKIFQPFPGTGSMPSVAIPGDHKLVPVSHTSMTSYFATEQLSSPTHGRAVLFGRSRVSQRLMSQIAPIADQVA